MYICVTMYSVGMSNKQNKTSILEQQVKELHAIIQEERELGNKQIADLYQRKLEEVLANAELVGNNPQ